ncbi:MAG TPA: glycosyltransferase family 2 protein [Terriglobales bacterium]|jgi:glycosyltransferase involved in cell wall biosynthesis|nr:glycosyltransferase family 2 protein [Terriglobales bacterium]
MEDSRVSVLILTFNEELNLPDCLRSVVGWSDDVWVVDSGSSDGTLAIAETGGASISQHAWEGYARQKNWALENLPWRHKWVLILDADERLSPELAREITELVSLDGNGFSGFYLNRRFIFYGKWIRHCGWYPSWNLRLFQREMGRYEMREVHEHLVLNGPAGYCKHDLIHEDLRDMTSWIEKHNGYATLEAKEVYRLLNGQSTALRGSLFGGSIERKRFLKERVWPYLPGKSIIYFIYMYIFRLGFLDGGHGFRFCLMHGIFQEFCTAKLWESARYAGVINGKTSLSVNRTKEAAESEMIQSVPSGSNRATGNVQKPTI